MNWSLLTIAVILTCLLAVIVARACKEVSFGADREVAGVCKQRGRGERMAMCGAGSATKKYLVPFCNMS